MKPEKVLRNITALIVQCCNPDKVVLFGSYAKGHDGPDKETNMKRLSCIYAESLLSYQKPFYDKADFISDDSASNTKSLSTPDSLKSILHKRHKR